MRYVKGYCGTVVTYTRGEMGTTWMLANGWIAYAGDLPDSLLCIVDGAVVEMSAPEPTHEWVDKSIFVNAVTSMIPEDQRQSAATRWQTIWGIAQLPGDMVDLIDARVPAFLDGLGLAVDAVRAQITALAGVADAPATP